MTTSHYVDGNGNYIGGFGDGAMPSSGTLVATAPASANDTWNGTQWISPPPTAEMVDAEAQRRTDAIFPAEKRDETSLHGVALLMKGQANWNTADLTAVAAADALWSQVEPIRAAAEVIKAMDPIPDDYADDSRWP